MFVCPELVIELASQVEPSLLLPLCFSACTQRLSIQISGIFWCFYRIAKLLHNKEWWSARPFVYSLGKCFEAQYVERFKPPLTMLWRFAKLLLLTFFHNYLFTSYSKNVHYFLLKTNKWIYLKALYANFKYMIYTFKCHQSPIVIYVIMSPIRYHNMLAQRIRCQQTIITKNC